MRVAHFKIPSTLTRDESAVVGTFIRTSCWYVAYGVRRQWRRRLINNYAVSTSGAKPFKLQFIHVAVRGRVVNQPSTQPASRRAASRTAYQTACRLLFRGSGCMCVCACGGNRQATSSRCFYNHFTAWKSRAKRLIMTQRSRKMPLHKILWLLQQCVDGVGIKSLKFCIRSLYYL